MKLDGLRNCHAVAWWPSSGISAKHCGRRGSIRMCYKVYEMPGNTLEIAGISLNRQNKAIFSFNHHIYLLLLHSIYTFIMCLCHVTYNGANNFNIPLGVNFVTFAIQAIPSNANPFQPVKLIQ